MITLSGDVENDVPPMLFEGRSDGLIRHFRRHVSAARFLLVLLLTGSAVYLAAANGESILAYNTYFLVIAPVVMLLGVYLLRRWWQV